jgi:HD-GYP domain-containing protein (c-di-GMP phosphodiesterase class II)
VAAGTVLGLPPDELRDLRRAGLLHDIGKLAISSRILDKPGELDADEFAAMREHPRYTMQILERVACFRGIVEVAASHHERLDGTGFHRALPGHEVSRSARILAVADVYEALTADRPYRAAMPREKALLILHEQRGTGLCPAAVDALDAAAHGTAPWTADLRAPSRAKPPVRAH